MTLPISFFSRQCSRNRQWLDFRLQNAVCSLKKSEGWQTAILVIDEIQKIYNWSEAIKKNGTVTPSATQISEYFFLVAVVSCLKKGDRNLWPAGSKKYTAGLEKFKELFKPTASFIVGDSGISPEDFLSMDLSHLF